MTSYNVDMIVEISKNSYVKYEFDKKTNMLRCDRILGTSMQYMGNYGYIANTLSEDKDPIDCLMLCEYPLYPMTLVTVRIIGVLMMEDESGKDEKLLVVPITKIDPNYSEINNYTDLPQSLLLKIKHFFEHYKDTEVNKWVKIDDFYDKDKAVEVFKDSQARYYNVENKDKTKK